MQIKLRVNGEDKTFVNDFLSFRNHYDAIALNEEFQKNNYSLTKQYDRLAEFVVIVFGKQFSAEELMNGISSVETLQEVFHECLKIGGLKVEGADEGKSAD